MSKLNYLHKELKQSLKDGVVTTYEEVIIDGPKGVTIKYFSKDGNSEEKITINEKNGKFILKIKNGDKVDEKSLSKDEFIDELKKNKKLKFAADFVKTQKGGAWLNRPKKASSTKKVKKASSAKKAKSKTGSAKKAKRARKVKKGSK